MAWSPSPPLAVWKTALPDWLTKFQVVGLSLADWTGLGVLTGVALVVGVLARWLLAVVIRLAARRSRTEWDDRIADLLPGPLGILAGVLTFGIAVPLLELPQAAADAVEVVARTLLIVAVTALVLRLLTVAAGALEAYLAHSTDDESRRRAVRTQIAVPGGILRAVAVVVGVALILLQFDVVRSVGVSLLASAGLAGIVLGLAAQKAVGNMLAGIQLAIFQPIRIGDVVVVEGEWGRVEEIGLTQVVVAIWDQRRLMLPVSYFLDRPFTNWTHGTSDLLGTVFLFADYSVPVEAIRTELAAILQETPLWDGRVQGVQVTNLTAETVEVRVLVSAGDGSRLWDLRCLVREKLLAWLQNAGQAHLPRKRVELRAPAAREEPPT